MFLLQIISRDLLYSEDIEVSYFAAGIAAHLSSYSVDRWTVKTITKEQLIQDLVSFYILGNPPWHTNVPLVICK